MLRYDVTTAELAELLAQAHVADYLADGVTYTGDNDDQVVAWMDQACGSPDKLPFVRDCGGWLEFWSNGRAHHVHPGDRVTLSADGWFTVEVA